MSTRSPSRPEVLRRIIGEFEQIFASLAPLAGSFAEAVDGPPGDRPESLARLREAAFEVLDRHQGLVAGAGAVAAPDAMPGSRYWLHWWWTRTTGDPEALRVNLDPAAPDFFDYTGADWYQTPMRTGARHVAGPYVDYACTNEYALTVVAPVTVEGQFAGVAAADVLVSSLERRLLPALRSLTQPAVLLNGGGRVIASTSPEFASGMRVALPAPRSTRRPALDWHLVPAAGLG